MNLRALMLATVAAVSISTPALSQVVSEVEGKLQTLKRQAKVNGVVDPAHFSVFKTKVYFKAENGTVISTPTRDKIGFGVLMTCNSTKVPGFSKLEDTLVGGTAIATGTSSESGVVADTLFVEPAENVLLGRVTSVPVANPGENNTVTYDGELTIDGTPVVVIGKSATEQYTTAPLAITDVFNPCFPGKGVKNAFFIDIPPTNITVGTLAAAEGWYGEDGRFYAFLIEGEGSVKDQPVSIGIGRAQCRNRGGTRGLEWEIRGGVGVPVESADPTVKTFPDARGSVTFGRPVVNPTTGVSTYKDYGMPTTAIAVDPTDGAYGSFNIRADVASGLAAGEGCPETVIVRYTPTGGKVVTGRSGVDAR